MSDPQPNAYLRDAVMTASQEQLQLMLYDGAIRFATEGKQAVADHDYERAFERLTRAQKIMLEMDRGLRPDIAPDLCSRMSSVYMFVYRRLIDGCVDHDTKAIDEALDVLNFERETWRMLMEKITSETADTGNHDHVSGDSEGGLSIEG